MSISAFEFSEVASAVRFIRVVTAVIHTIAQVGMTHTSPVDTREQIFWASAVSFVTMIPAVVEPIALEVLGNTLAIGTLELRGWAEAEGFI